MAKKEKQELEEMTAPFWMVTFSDLVTLLMVFFILILSFSTIQLEKFKGAMTSFKGALGIMPDDTSVLPSLSPNFSTQNVTEKYEVVESMDELEQTLKEMGLEDVVSLEFDGTGVIVRIGDDLLFSSGKAAVKRRANPVLDAVIAAFKGKYKDIFVEGHTDNVPIRSSKFPSNWELSSSRALNVVKYLNRVGKIKAKNLAAVGHGEHRPLVPNSSRENRAKNRRVEIYFRMK